MYALNAEKKIINNYSLSFLRKVCILVKNKINQTYILCIHVNVKKISGFKGKSPKFDI